MALQGTLETFALPDVLRLLASTKKSGVLRIETDRGQGELVVIDGEITGGAADRAPLAESSSDVLFEMLRSTDGSFLFDADADTTGGTATPQSVEAALELAEEQLAEWREIEAVVPSPQRHVTIRTERGDGDITLTADQWRAIAALAGGCTVEDLGGRLGLTELPATRLVRDLIALDAVTLSDSDVEGTASPHAVSAEEPAPTPEPIAEPVFAAASIVDAPFQDEPSPAAHQPDAVTSFLPAPGADDTGGAPGYAPDSFSVAPSHDPEPLAPVAPLFGSAEPRTALHDDAPSAAPAAPEAPAAWDASSSFATPSSSFFDDDEDEDDPLADDPFGPDPFRIPRLPSANEPQESSEAAEMARQLANLSPRAAQAVAAAAAASSDQERDEALAQVADESEEPLNRGLLLKFLSSVDE